MELSRENIGNFFHDTVSLNLGEKFSFNQFLSSLLKEQATVKQFEFSNIVFGNKAKPFVGMN